MTIKDIARESGYSIGTVSRVLNNHPTVSKKAYKVIMEVIEKNNFRVNENAKHLKKVPTSIVCVIVKGAKNMLFSSILEELQLLISGGGYVCSIYYINEFENEVEKAIYIEQERNIKGIIFLGSFKQYFMESFQKIKSPSVLITSSAKDLGFKNLSSVCVDDREAAKAVVNHLFKKGIYKIAILGGRKGLSYAAYERYMGCVSAYEESGIDFVSNAVYAESNFAVEDGYLSMLGILKEGTKVGAVFALADVLAIGAMRAIADMNIDIRDFSIIGFDGIELCNYLIPKLSTVVQPDTSLAREGFKLLNDLLEGRSAWHTIVPFELRIAESSV